MQRTTRAIAILVLLGLAAVGCGDETVTGEEVGYRVVTVADLEAGDAVPVPTGDVVLTLTGAISITNADDALELDMATLERLGVVEYVVDDQQAEGRVVTFQGVLMRDLLALAGADPGATEMEMTALNDYAVSVPVTDVHDFPVLLATQSDGTRMPVANYGPTRLIYPYESFDLDPAVYDPRWIWQLATIDVR